jgi:hypothetical protein
MQNASLGLAFFRPRFKYYSVNQPDGLRMKKSACVRTL